MLVFLCHFAAIIYYIEFDIRAIAFAQHILSDIQSYSDNLFTFLVQLCTLWNLVLQQIYLLGVTIDDAYRLSSKSKVTQKRTFTHPSISSLFTRYVFPCSIVISTNFWTVFCINPRYVDEHSTLVTHMTAWDNHGMHTIPVIFVFLEMFAAHRLYPRNLITELRASISLTAIYFGVVAVNIPASAIWAYHFFGMFSWYHWAMYLAANLLLACSANLVGYGLSSLIWGKHCIETSEHTSVMKWKNS